MQVVDGDRSVGSQRLNRCLIGFGLRPSIGNRLRRSRASEELTNNDASVGPGPTRISGLAFVSATLLEIAR